MNTESISWSLFEATGSIEAYLNYRADCEEKNEESAKLGDSEDGRDSHKRG